jgi:hypothetical protein
MSLYNTCSLPLKCCTRIYPTCDPSTCNAFPCAAAAALREQAQSPLPQSEREVFEQTIATAKAELDENTFTQEWSAGSVLSQEEVVDYALSDACA